MPRGQNERLMVCMALTFAVSAFGQAPYRAPRTPDGKANLNGIWQALNSANWNIVGHAADFGSLSQMGAQGATPPGIGVIDGDSLPYLPAAALKQKDNYKNRLTLDPEVKCFLPGVPRATYQDHPFQIVQSPDVVMFIYEFAGGVRSVPLKNPGPAPAPSWMGWSWAKWEGDTLVVDGSGFNDTTWFDRAGNFHSDALHVVERYTPRSAETMNYEATIEDAKTYSRPFKISMPLYRHVEKNAQLMEFKCVEFVEELMYGHLRKGAQKK